MVDTELGLGAGEVVRAYCDAWLAGDALAVLSLYHDDLTLVWPGRHRHAGTYVGKQASIEALVALQADTNRVPVRIVEIVPQPRSVAVTVIERWSRDGQRGETEVLEHTRLLVYTVEDHLLRTCRVEESAQREVDDWLAAPSEADDDP